MQSIDAQVRGDVTHQLTLLRQDMEEGLANITENNLKLSQPYAASRSGNIELELAEVSGAKTLQVYQDGVLYGSVQLL
ncbi:MAG: hypothetical protein HFI90_11170 [Clostridia bacterium]|nr:hypothetical protein [Clostridia bacterium]